MRRGVALLAVMSAMIAIAAVGALARSRIVLENRRLDRARLRTAAIWRAEGCLALARAGIDAALQRGESAAANWSAIDSIVQMLPATLTLSECSLSARSEGHALSSADRRSLARVNRFLVLSGFRAEVADSLASALADWEDSDSVERPSGAEQQWYTERRRLGPRNAAIRIPRELALVRGFEREEIRRAAMGLIGGTSDELCAAHASTAVIAARLGTSLETAESIKRADRPELTISALGILSSADDSDESGRRRSSRQVIAACNHWRITATTALGHEHDSASVTLSIASANRRAAVVGVEVLPP